ncbi:MAG: DJ-1/PfpI family protein [Clostridia bacterium]|nr:DJ-1/PfpI family protein [Clostridia bacterium]MDR3644894.1 DJ-1/PfpI family protein [Clostridia bacterium]
MVYLFLAQGFEEAEAVVPADVLRRAGVEVRLVGVGGRLIRGVNGIAVEADIEEGEAKLEGLEMIVLPGGAPGYINLEKSAVVQKFIDFAFEKGIWIGAICAAPSILGRKGLLKGKNAICYPGHEGALEGAAISPLAVCEDGNIITAKGPGVSLEFGLALAAKLKGECRAKEISDAMQCSRI